MTITCDTFYASITKNDGCLDNELVAHAEGCEACAQVLGARPLHECGVRQVAIEELIAMQFDTRLRVG